MTMGELGLESKGVHEHSPPWHALREGRNCHFSFFQFSIKYLEKCHCITISVEFELCLAGFFSPLSFPLFS